MIQVIVFILGVVIGGGFVWILERINKGGEGVVFGIVKYQKRQKEENKKKILEFLNVRGCITNNDVEESVGVSDATAERYLNELEKEEVLKQVGKSGHAVFYEKM